MARTGRPALAASAALAVFVTALGVTAPTALAADDCANAALRTGLSADLPDCRAYERVSPSDPNTNRTAGVGQSFTPMVAKARADGERVMYTAMTGIGRIERAGYNMPTISYRTADGWSTFGALTSDGEVDLDQGAHMPLAPYPSADLSRVGFRVQRGLGGENPGTNNGNSTYLTAPGGVGAPTWLSKPAVGGPIPDTGTASLILGGSPDLSTTYFVFGGKLTDQFGDAARTAAGLYMSRDGVLSPAGRLPSGNVDPGGAMPAGSGSAESGLGSDLSVSAMHNSVSRDGTRLFFVTPRGGGANGYDTATVRQLYVQQDGEPGRLISKDLSGNPAADGVAGLGGAGAGATEWTRPTYLGRGYAFATPDGKTVVFRSRSVLAAGAPAGAEVKTYRARITDGAITVEYVGQVSGAPLAVSDDGSKVLFVETVGSSPNTVTNIKFWDEDRPGGISYLLASTAYITDVTGIMNVRLTPDGSTLLFDSSADILPGIPMPPVTGAGMATTQVYRWVVGDARPTCLSCRKDGLPFGRFGARSANIANITTDNVARPNGLKPDNFNQGTLSHQQGISDDGRRVAFDTIDPLDPVRDTNGQRDVYLWEDGEVHLLTSGKGDAPSFLIDSSASGDDVFVTTQDGLVPEDVNRDYDVYDVRVGGGFAPKVVPSCTDDGCQGEHGAAPGVAAAMSPLLAPVTVGSKRLLSGPAEKTAKLRVTRGKSTRSRVVLRVRTPGAGKIRARGKGLKTTEKKATRATTYTVKVRLSASARRTLGKKGRVKVRVRVRFTPTKGRAATKSVSVTLKRVKHKNGRGR